jgi:arylsulfatase A-like enzyme
MTRRTWLGVLASVAAVTVAGTPAGAQQTQKPNVVFILADNVGYGDLGAYGGGELRGAPTPSIDQLAREGLRLTQFLVEPACTPSRAALMTGRYSIRSGLSLIAIEGSPNIRQVAPWKRATKPSDCAWLRRVLRHSAEPLLGCGDLRRHHGADAFHSSAA